MFFRCFLRAEEWVVPADIRSVDKQLPTKFRSAGEKFQHASGQPPPRDDKVAQASCRKLSAFADNHRTDMCQVLYFNQHLATWQIDLRTNA